VEYQVRSWSFFAVLEKHFPGSIDDLVILQWMAYYELRGFHSLGEVWTALHPFLKAMGYSHDGAGTNHIKLKVMDIEPPMTTTGCVSTTNEGAFLTALRKFVGKLADELDVNYAKTVKKLTARSRRLFGEQVDSVKMQFGRGLHKKMAAEEEAERLADEAMVDDSEHAQE